MLQFTASLPTGPSTIRVQYATHAADYSRDDDAYRWWQFGYTFSPSRDWRSFGELHIQVDVPRNWQIASSLPLERSGDRLSLTTKGIPADSLGLTVRSNGMPYFIATAVNWAALALVVCLAVATAAKLGVILSMRRCWKGWGILTVPAIATLATAVSFCLSTFPVGSQASKLWVNSYEVFLLRLPLVWLLSLFLGEFFLYRYYQRGSRPSATSPGPSD